MIKRVFIKFFLFSVLGSILTYAQQNPLNIPFFDLNIRPASDSGEVSLVLQVLLMLTVLTLVPSILIMTTSFVRVSIVLNFIKRSLSLQQEPPNQVIMALALFLTFYIMMPTFKKIYDESYVPYTQQEISTQDFFISSSEPLKEFMLRQVRQKDLDLFHHLANKERPKDESEVSFVDLVPAFMISELTKAFQIGVLLFIPFIVIDMIVASILMSMGMIMIPPVMISLPFKVILFILVDGWHLIVLQTVKSFG